MAQSTDRILTTHVGSLIRPPELVAFLRGKDAGLATDETAFAACLKASVAGIVRQQAEIGIDILNDGEFGKTISWSRYILERMTGFEQRDRKPGDTRFAVSTYGRDRREFADFYKEYDPKQGFTGMVGWVVTGPIAYQGHAALQRDIADLKTATAGVGMVDAFMPAVAPASVLPEHDDQIYKTTKSTCSLSRMRCTRNTGQSSMPA